MARSSARASIIGSNNTRFTNTTGNLNLNVNLAPQGGTINQVTAAAYSENGISNDASANALTDANVGIRFSSPGSTGPSAVIRSSRGGNIQVRGATDVVATAARTTTLAQTQGTALAQANFTGNTGGIINDASANRINEDAPGLAPAPDIKIAQAGQVDVGMSNLADALAAGEQGAFAQADMGNGFFGIANTGIEINGGAVNGTPSALPESRVVADIEAGIVTQANSTFGDASANSGTLANTTEVVGIYNGLVSDYDGSGNNQETLRIGFASSGLVDASANVLVSSTAVTQDGDASANSSLALAAGIYNADNGVIDGSNVVLNTYTTDLLIEIDGPLSIVEGDAAVFTDATAISNSGQAIATIDTSLIGGIVDERTLNGEDPSGTRIQFGSSGTVRANAFADNEAYAESSGDLGADASYAQATIDNDEVVGLAMDVVADGSLSIEASATSIQNATAIGDNFDGGSDPYAEVAFEDFVAGVTNSDISTLGNLQGISIAGTLVGNASAESDQGTGGTTAIAGFESNVFGIVDSSLNVLGGLQSDGGTAMDLDVSATSQLSATATSNTDNVTALVGGDPLIGIANVTGIDNTDITIFGGGADQGAINVAVTGSADAEATTQSGSAYAGAFMIANGVQGSDIFLRGDTAANAAEGLNVTVDLTGSAIASGADASGTLFLQAGGIDLSGNTIEIDRNGSVTAATTITDPTLSVTSTNGSDVDASGFVGAFGIQSDFGNITLGDNGSIVGSAIITDAVVEAETNSFGDASGSLLIAAGGLVSPNGTTDFTAGRNSGNVDGQALASGTVSATSVNGAAFADASGVLAGISGIDITAGLLTPGNSVVGISDGNFTTTATATGIGSAFARSDMEGYGIRGGGFESGGRNRLTVSGGIRAQATLVNNVIADAQGLGIAEAVSNGRVVGIENMDVSTIGPSTINVQAGGIFSATSYGGSLS